MFPILSNLRSHSGVKSADPTRLHREYLLEVASLMSLCYSPVPMRVVEQAFHDDTACRIDEFRRSNRDR